jgi:Phage gp6-like head-tail connector protein
MTPDDAPTLADIKTWLGITDEQDDALLSTSLAASLAAQDKLVGYPLDPATGVTTMDDDLAEAVMLRTQRLAARRNSPEAIVGVSGVGGDFVTARLVSNDPDIVRLEGPFYKMVVA